MKRIFFVSMLIGTLVLVRIPNVFAMETDQYDLPPVPLADIGDEVTEYVLDNLREAITAVNADIAKSEACISAAKESSECGTVDKERAKLALLRRNEALVAAVYKQLGDGTIFTAHVGKWFATHKFRSGPATYKTKYTESIYMGEPIDYFTMSPTINMYGKQFGTDKLEHFFQQGYKYYNLQKRELDKGKSESEAEKRAVKWGRFTENTYFGLLVAGVYSNADLLANYIGMRFYEGLSAPVKISDGTRPATFVLNNGKWEFNPTADQKNELLKPFLTDHLNEALNPSVYAFHVYPVVKSVVKKKSCGQWLKAYPNLTKSNLEATTNSLTQWNGEDYGYKSNRLMVKLADVCFSDRSDRKAE